MKNILFLLFFPCLLFSQVNFSEDISPIIYNNCTECHRDGQAGPMPFTSYEEVVAVGGPTLQVVTASGYMPPWHADTDYSSFLGERGLTDEDIQLIADWVSGGMLQGDPNLEAIIPEFPEGSVIGEPDLVLTMEEEYLIEGNNQDDYRVFVFSTNFDEEKDLKSIEFIPDNREAVHHVLVNIDTEGACAALDAATPEYGYPCESGFCTGNIPLLATGYVPGMVPPIWRNDVGLKLPAGADIAIQVHYAPSSIDEYDQSSINVFFKDEEIEREVQVETIIDVTLEVPANEVPTIHKSFEVPSDISLLSILPHMHLIGKSWLVYAENASGDTTIPIISIPDWDFNWQNFYQPKYMLKIPANYTIHAYATYDNTSDNSTNPNDPPQDMFWCDYTTCEMFFLPFSYVPYQEDDEYIYLGDPDDIGCMDLEACNYSEIAIIEEDFNNDGVGDACDYECLGCMDSTACNYDLDALFGDDSCEYESCAGCLDMSACNYDGDATILDDSCDYSCYGCTDSNACNYDGDATILDGSCDYSCIGCTDSNACNYNQEAIIDNGTCGISDDCGTCHIPCCFDLDALTCDYSVSEENCENFWADFDIVSDPSQNIFWNTSCVLGCTDPEAINYEENAGVDDDSCIYAGCTDPEAQNYCEYCTLDDESCIYEVIFGCMDVNAFNYNPNANVNDGSCYPFIGGCLDATFAEWVSPTGDVQIDANIDDGSCVTLIGCWPGETLHMIAWAGILDNTFEITNTAGEVVFSDYWWLNEEGFDVVCFPSDDCYTVNTGVTVWNIYACPSCGPDGTGDNNEFVLILSSDSDTMNFGLCYGCTDSEAYNFDPGANMDDGSCEYLGCLSQEACNYCPECTIPSECDYSCYGCMDELACNYDVNATIALPDYCEYPQDYYDCNGDCINDLDEDGVCDEVDCFTVLCYEFYECVLGDCVCINDSDGDGICDENEEDCLDLNLISVNQINPDQFSVMIENNSSENIFPYPGFVLFNEFGDTIAIEDVDYYGIANQSIHVLDIQESVEITENFNLELYTWYYESFACEWDDLALSENCDLDPDPGPCLAAFEAYYFNDDTGQCEVTWWGGCAGIVPFWTLEECQNACEPILLPELDSDKNLIKKVDLLGRKIIPGKGFVINIYDDGTVEKEFIVVK